MLMKFVVNYNRITTQVKVIELVVLISQDIETKVEFGKNQGF